MTIRFLAVLAALGLTACSGGGSTAAPRAASTPASQSASRGSLSLTVHYSAIHLQGATRVPKFIDGDLNSTINVNAWGDAGAANTSVPVSPDAYGNQTININAYSATNGWITIYEADIWNTTLAQTSTSYSLIPGGTGTLNATLDLVPQGVFVATSLAPLTIKAVGAVHATPSGSTYSLPDNSTLPGVICAPNPTFIGATDALGGFANPAGAVPGNPTSVSLISQSGSALISNGVSGTFNFSGAAGSTTAGTFLVQSPINQNWPTYTVTINFQYGNCVV